MVPRAVPPSLFSQELNYSLYQFLYQFFPFIRIHVVGMHRGKLKKGGSKKYEIKEVHEVLAGNI